MSRRRSKRRCPYGFETSEQCPYLRTQDLLTTVLALLLTETLASSGEGKPNSNLVEELVGKLLGVRPPGPPPAPAQAKKTGAKPT